MVTLNNTLLESIESKFQDKGDDELRQILTLHDPEAWSEEAFEAARNILAKRGIALPSKNDERKAQLQLLFSRAIPVLFSGKVPDLTRRADIVGEGQLTVREHEMVFE